MMIDVVTVIIRLTVMAAMITLADFKIITMIVTVITTPSHYLLHFYLHPNPHSQPNPPPFPHPPFHLTPTLTLPSLLPSLLPPSLTQPASGDSGWEVFSLDYVVDVPLNAVVHAEAMARYRVAFHMLWRLKRVEWSLSGSWKQLMSFSHARGEEPLPALKPVLHRYVHHNSSFKSL